MAHTMSMTRDVNIFGIYPMLYAFFTRENLLDRNAHRKQVNASIAGGAHGLAIGGLASECNKLSTEEKRQLLEWTIEDAAGHVPISVTLTENTLSGQQSAIAHACESGAAWGVMQPPPVRGATPSELVNFFAQAADKSDMPLGIQNAPEYIGIGLDNQAMIDLAQRAPRIQILKAEGPSPYISQLMKEVGHHFTVFNGRNGVELIDNLRAGCAGTIPGVECCDVQAEIYDLWHAGDIAEATDRFRQVLPLLSFLMLTIDHLLCYGKRLAARRLQLGTVYDRGPALPPDAANLATLDFWSNTLASFPEN
jgi:4-hydroxy-tetrahydrodipicolinate synthase